MAKRSEHVSAPPPLHLDADGYDSSYEGNEEEKKSKRKKLELKTVEKSKPTSLPSRGSFAQEYAIEARRSMLSQLRSLTAYDRHKLLINEYYLSNSGTGSIFKRDTSKDKRDIDVIRENHQFVWEENDTVNTWGKQLAKKYYDKLFKEYCICDLRKYKENKVGLRWRVEKEVVSGKGQFDCGEQSCAKSEGLRTWEVNFAYVEHGSKKNTLVKIRLCTVCSQKLNFCHQKTEVIKKKKQTKEKKRRIPSEYSSESKNPAEEQEKFSLENNTLSPSTSKDTTDNTNASGVWCESKAITEDKTREEEFEEYLQDLLF